MYKKKPFSIIFFFFYSSPEYRRDADRNTRLDSTMSAQLNTVSGTIYEDFIVKMMGVQLSDLTASVVMKCTVVVTGFVCVALVIVVERLNGILQVSARRKRHEWCTPRGIRRDL